MKKSGMMAAVALAAGLTEEESTGFELTSAFVKQHFASVATDLLNEGAKAEHARLTGIEAASMPGHEDLIKAFKADASKSPADAALAVITAENAKIAAIKSSLSDDEKKLKGLKSTALPSGEAPTPSQRNAAADAKAARNYIASQKTVGITVSAIDAVNHIQSLEG